MITAGIWLVGISIFSLFAFDEDLKEKGLQWFQCLCEMAYGAGLVLLTFGVNQ